MRRRDFLTLGGATALAAASVGAQAQQAPAAIIGFLAPGSKTDGKRFYDGFPAGMRERGYVEGRDYILESRFAEGDFSQLKGLAEQLLRAKPQIVVSGTEAAAVAIRSLTAVVPIVAINMFEPIKDGLISAEAHPGGNVTGTLQYLPGLTSKQIELACEIVPRSRRIGLLINPINPISVEQRRESEATASKLKLELFAREVQSADELDSVFKTFARDGVDLVSVFRDVLFVAKRRQIASFALASRLPTVYGFREHVESGGLLSYGIDIRETYRRAAYYVDRLLKGAKPADVPVEFPTKLELVLNVTTAKALDIAIPPGLLARADAVIE